MKSVVFFALELEVYDADALAEAAQARAIAEGIDPADAAETYTADDPAACAQMLLDPGTLPGASILESSAEA